MSSSARITRLTLHEIRTYPRLDLELGGGTTVLVGANGVGKTNLLEACAVVLSGASPRTSSELRLVREGEAAGRIAATVLVGDDQHDRDVVFQHGKGKQLRVDGSPARSVEEFSRQVPVVTFLPERLLVIRGAPQRRRALVDQLAARLVPSAARTQRDYAAALQQRNALLRRAKIGHDVAEQLAPWTQQLLEHGAAFRDQRSRFLELIAEPHAARFAELTGLADATFAAELRGSGDLAADAAELESAERRRGSTLLGPHLDDILPRVAGRDLRAFGSAGEQRAALLAFTFAARDALTAHLGIEPVVLLDEPWSELDQDRRRRLTSMLAPLAQVIVTSTEPPAHLDEVLDALHVLAVTSGQVQTWDPTDHDSPA
ncbi:MAG: recF [Thermoleophilia bacterium]|nr:recF [Thermoleophilia bacterium]